MAELPDTEPAFSGRAGWRDEPIDGVPPAPPRRATPGLRASFSGPEIRTRLTSARAGVGLLVAAPARADDWPLPQRFAERGSTTPGPALEHSAARAGHPLSVSRFAAPSVTRRDHGGYIGGGSLKGNSLMASGPGWALGALCGGPYGTDHGGHSGRYGPGEARRRGATRFTCRGPRCALRLVFGAVPGGGMDLVFESPRGAIGAFYVLTDCGVPAVYLPDLCHATALDDTQFVVPTVRVPASHLFRARAILDEHGLRPANGY